MAGVKGMARRASCLAVAASLFLLSLSGCGHGKAAAGISDDGTIRGMLEGSYVNVLVQLGFKSDMGDGFYEFYYETDGDVSHVYDMMASVSVKGQVVNVSGEIWSDGETSWSTSGRGWQETGIPMGMDVATLPGLFGYEPDIVPKRDDNAGYYVFAWETELGGIADSGIFSLVGDLEGLDLSGPAEATLRTSQKDGSFAALRVEAEAAAMSVLLNHTETEKTLEIPEDVIAKAASFSPAMTSDSETTDPAPDGTASANTSQEMKDLEAVIWANDEGLNLLEASSEQGVEYIYYETNESDAWYAWVEVGRPADGDAEALFLEKKAAMESVLGTGAYESTEDYLVHVQQPNSDAADGTGTTEDWYAYVLAYGDGFVLNLVVQDWTAGTWDSVVGNAMSIVDYMGVNWHA